MPEPVGKLFATATYGKRLPSGPVGERGIPHRPELLLNARLLKDRVCARHPPAERWVARVWNLA